METAEVLFRKLAVAPSEDVGVARIKARDAAVALAGGLDAIDAVIRRGKEHQDRGAPGFYALAITEIRNELEEMLATYPQPPQKSQEPDASRAAITLAASLEVIEELERIAKETHQPERRILEGVGKMLRHRFTRVREDGG